MEPINPHLFVYGTLLDSSNNYAAYLQQHCTLLQQGKFKGRLYDMGEYPGAIADAHCEQYVYGSIYLMTEPEKVLTIIDDYEGFGAEQEQPNLFIRIQAAIETNLEPVMCWVYIYNLPIEHFAQIQSGRYLK
jgi:gamma-glutamylcyclotransferase (GGCT)/AIG2-like uncharacterized protein YtfP